MKNIKPDIAFIAFIACKTAGFALLLCAWLASGDIALFFLFLTLVLLTLLRQRFSTPKLWFTLLADCALLWFWGHYVVLAVFAVSEVFYRVCLYERRRGLQLRDVEAGRFYEQADLQNDLASALAQVERMTAVAERARIARDIHDNAGHELVAAYISLQTAREMLGGGGAQTAGAQTAETQTTEALELYDTALERLGAGVNKIREAVHNLSTVSILGIDNLRETCRRFPVCDVEFNAYGDSSGVPVYVWNMLDACLSESLTNIARHCSASYVTVDFDVTPHIIRLCLENDGAGERAAATGTGLRNLRHRAAAIGGNLSVDAGGEVFRVICVVPAQSEGKSL